ncbi:hypothetical protein QTP70_031850, partial [Hemibagrus guttatus]
EVLMLQRETYEAAVEAQVLEDAESESESEEVKYERSSEYVHSQINLQSRPPSPLLLALAIAPPLNADSHNSFITWSPPMKDASHVQSVNNKPKSEKADSMHLPTKNLSDLSAGAMKSEVRRSSLIMNAHAKPYVPRYVPPASTSAQTEPLAQYLARRNLISSGLYQFDDKPENYWSWYSSFTSAAREVHLTATQELDLMTKWLGKESGEMVIRSVHVSNPNLETQSLRETTTCSGIIETSGKKAEGFQIETLDGKVLIPLPPLIECHKIMNNRCCGISTSESWASRNRIRYGQGETSQVMLSYICNKSKQYYMYVHNRFQCILTCILSCTDFLVHRSLLPASAIYKKKH